MKLLKIQNLKKPETYFSKQRRHFTSHFLSWHKSHKKNCNIYTTDNVIYKFSKKVVFLFSDVILTLFSKWTVKLNHNLLKSFNCRIRTATDPNRRIGKMILILLRCRTLVKWMRERIEHVFYAKRTGFKTPCEIFPSRFLFNHSGRL